MTIAQEMYDETSADGRRRYTVAQIAAEFGATRPTIYRHLASEASPQAKHGRGQLFQQAG